MQLCFLVWEAIRWSALHLSVLIISRYQIFESRPRHQLISSLPEPYPLSLRFQVFSNRSFPYHLYKADMQSQQTELRWQAASAAERLTFFSRHVRCCLFLLSRRQRCHRSRRETQAADGEALADGQLSLTIWWEALEFSPRVALFL